VAKEEMDVDFEKKLVKTSDVGSTSPRVTFIRFLCTLRTQLYDQFHFYTHHADYLYDVIIQMHSHVYTH
jgi:hypothetical protein